MSSAQKLMRRNPRVMNTDVPAEPTPPQCQTVRSRSGPGNTCRASEGVPAGAKSEGGGDQFSVDRRQLDALGEARGSGSLSFLSVNGWALPNELRVSCRALLRPRRGMF